MTGPASVSAGVDLGGGVARATLVVAPLLAFNVFRLPGIATLAMVLPLTILALVWMTTSGHRFPAWELLLVAILCLSVLWGDGPAYSVERLRTYVPLVLATALAGSMVPSVVVMRCLRISFVVIIGSSLVALAIDPASSLRPGFEQPALTGQFTKNVYGGLLIVALLLLLQNRRRANLLLGPALVIMITANRSATAWVVAALLVTAAYASRGIIARLGPRASKPALTAMMVSGVGAIALVVSSDVGSALAALGKDPTLGLRTEIWAACWQQVKEAPLLGHGAYTFLNTDSDSPVTRYVWSRFQNYYPPHPHNGFLDLVGQIGLVGLLAYLGLILHGLRRGAARALDGDDDARTAILLIVSIVLSGATEPTYLGPWLILTIMCVAITRGVPERSPTRVSLASATASHDFLPR